MPNIVDVISKYVHLTQKGREYIGLCPFHPDKDPSLKVNPEKNLFKCFVCGKGGSASHFLWEYNKIKGTNYRMDTTDKEDKPKPISKLEDWVQVFPVPSFVEQPTFRHIKHGIPSQTWRYTNEKGQTMFYVCRFNIKGGKEVLPYTFCVNDGVGRWNWRGMRNGRPLYNIANVARCDKMVCLVEGEKTCDAGSKYSSEFVFCTFQGGTNAVGLTDYAPLKGRDVILLRDNDDVGKNAMREVYKILKPLVKSIGWIDDISDKPEKWDIADNLWAKGELDQFIKTRTVWQKE